jgi:hypothetical protein
MGDGREGVVEGFWEGGEDGIGRCLRGAKGKRNRVQNDGEMRGVEGSLGGEIGTWTELKGGKESGM